MNDPEWSLGHRKLNRRNKIGLAEPELPALARVLTEIVRKNVTIDWNVSENVRAHLRVLLKRIIRKHGYPPDNQAKATQRVLEQAEVLSELWVAA